MNHHSATAELPLFCPACGEQSAEPVVITSLSFGPSTSATAYQCGEALCGYRFSEYPTQRETEDDPWLF